MRCAAKPGSTSLTTTSSPSHSCSSWASTTRSAPRCCACTGRFSQQGSGAAYGSGSSRARSSRCCPTIRTACGWRAACERGCAAGSAHAQATAVGLGHDAQVRGPRVGALRQVRERAIGEIPVHQLLEERARSEEHTSELQSQSNLVCRLLLEKKKTQ